jgi:hypothetical protein
VVVQDHWVLHVHAGSAGYRSEQHLIEVEHAAGMAGPDGTHLDDQAVEQLHAGVLAQDAGFGHAVVVAHGERALEQSGDQARHAHSIGSSRR